MSYEIIQLAGKHDSVVLNIISAPGMLLQKLTTKEPTEDMLEVAIASIEAIYDWKGYLVEIKRERTERRERLRAEREKASGSEEN